MRHTWRITKSLRSTNPDIRLLPVNGKTLTAIQEKVKAFVYTLEKIPLQIQMLIILLQLGLNR
jgi:hypothetical protein